MEEIKAVRLDQFPNRILRETRQFYRLSGINTLCQTCDLVELELSGKSIQTPVWLTPVVHTIDRIQDQVKLELIEEDRFVNPFLVHQMGELVPSEDLPVDDSLNEWLQKHGLRVAEGNRLLGNFHHHRYQLIKELEELRDSESYSSGLRQLMGDEKTIDQPLALPVATLLPSDSDHEEVYRNARNGHLVIQGPPGTGKSQVVTNLIAKLLAVDASTVVVSEKRSALEVIPKKLAAFGLDKLCFIATSDRISGNFLADLKRTWDHFDRLETSDPVNMMLSEQLEDQLQMTLELLQKPNLIGGISFHEFLRQTKHLALQNAGYTSQVPDIPLLSRCEQSLAWIYANQLQGTLGKFRTSLLRSDTLDQLDQSIYEWKQLFPELSCHFSIRTMEELQSSMKKAALCQVFENELSRQFGKLLKPNSREQRRFLKLRKRYLTASKTAVSSEDSHWKIVPGEQETNALLRTLHNGGMFEKRKARKRWKGLSHLPVKEAAEALRTHRSKLVAKADFSQLLIEFCDLGLTNPEIEIEIIYQTLLQINKDTWQSYHDLPERERANLTAHHEQLHRLHSDLHRAFVLDKKTEIPAFLDELELALPQLISHKAALREFPPELLSCIRESDNLEALQSLVYNSHYIRFQEHFPNFAHFHPGKLAAKIDEIIRAHEDEAGLFARHIEYNIWKRFREYHALLNTPARKLSEEEKAMKTELRKGKSILVKEFSKMRSHRSLRDLFHSEARRWIQLLKPVWLSNPTQLGRCFPMTEHLFQAVIFDEASQIPLQNALGAIQRSERIIVAGDEQQMGPTSYFTRGAQMPIDLLHQASFYFPKVSLKHHYRSKHPDLIRFSNRHFYGGELRVYPGIPEESPALNYHFVENGRFIDRVNTPEAKAVATQIEQALRSDESIGVVAFSEEQLNAIWDEIALPSREKLQARLDENHGFFRALENVQGDECDHLIISFGYGLNEEGEFHHRFGPMNTANGRKRLNVLLTRSTSSIHFFASVRSDRFKLSENESVNLLRKWLEFMNTYAPSTSVEFPFGLTPKTEGKTLEFHAAYQSLHEAREFVTLHRALKERGWDVVYS